MNYILFAGILLLGIFGLFKRRRDDDKPDPTLKGV